MVISAITCLELLAGAHTQRETTDLDLVLSGYQAIPPNEDIARRAYHLMKIRTEMAQRAGKTQAAPGPTTGGHRTQTAS